LLFLGGAVYAGSINGKLKKFLKNLPDGQVKSIALFSTAAGEKGIRLKVEKVLRGKNIALLEREFHAASGDLKDNAEKIKEAAAQFARDIAEQ
ncbi:hypothetical protein LJC56_08765, partial [Christensenellaceae bacterium OttesenSCG-928-K19]|nr:hypothetical protein [Christensenellaceae bacterium OttesenSCG-928-K19]